MVKSTEISIDRSGTVYNTLTRQYENPELWSYEFPYALPMFQKNMAYKPFEYPWAYEYWQKQQQMHWLPEEVPMGEDVKEWKHALTDAERNLLTHIFRFFTQADIDVAGGYLDKYIPKLKNNEIRMMLASFANMETVHIAGYSYLLDTLGIPETEYSAFMEYQEMQNKHAYIEDCGTETGMDFLTTMATYAGFTEGMQLFASFAILLNFPRRGLMRGMGNIVSWSVRDESLHVEAMTRLFRTIRDAMFKRCAGGKDLLASRIHNACVSMVDLEDKFVDLAFEMGPVEGLTPQEVKQYIRYIADYRMHQMGYPPIYQIQKNPLPWVDTLVSGTKHTNFFESRATGYSRAATQGSWEDVEF